MGQCEELFERNPDDPAFLADIQQLAEVVCALKQNARWQRFFGGGGGSSAASAAASGTDIGVKAPDRCRRGDKVYRVV